MYVLSSQWKEDLLWIALLYSYFDYVQKAVLLSSLTYIFGIQGYESHTIF